MSYLFAATIGLLVGIAVLQIQHRDLVRMVVGLFLLWNATNLLLVGVGALPGVEAAIGEGPGLVDPLVRAFALTAIVITFGFTAFLLTLVFWLARRKGSLDVDALRDARR
jgi:multicomponent Na+:H+ antiporter subunit C